MRKLSLSALAVAGLLVGGFSAGSASAADLGGNCCADLEERIAELEATTVRKGNRKVSVTLSGWVAEQVMWWDDGFEDNVYVQGIGTTLASHFKITGSAQISPGWSAGYVIHVEVYGSENLLATNQFTPVGPSIYDDSDNFNGINTLQSYWFIKSDHLGKIGVGKQSMASDNTAILPDGSGSLVPANFVQFDYGGFFLRGTNGSGAVPGAANNLPWITVTGCTDCNGIPLNAVRYDSPTWHGFSVSASWGSDDIWDVAARYAGEWSGFKVAVAGAFAQTSNAPINDPFNAQAPDTDFWQVGAYVQHIPTGLWVYGAYTTINTNGNQVFGDADYVNNDSWYIKAGLRERWHPLGHTVIYGEYQRWNQDAGFEANITTGPDCQAGPECVAETDMWGVGIVQEIDAAAMSLWLSYRHLSADVTDVVENGAEGNVPTDDFQYVKFGALINF